MARGVPVNAETRARAVELMRAGDMSRNAIARELNLSGGSVSAIAREIGHEFDRASTELAMAARSIDLAKERQDLAAMFALEARRSLEDMHAPALMIQFEQGRVFTEYGENAEGLRVPVGTTSTPGSFREHVLPEPSFSDKRNLMTIAGIAVTKIAELTKASAAAGSEEGISFIESLADSLTAAAHHLRADPSTDPTAEPVRMSREEMIAELEAEETPES